MTKELILDLRDLGELTEDDLDGGCFADDGCIGEMQDLLLNYVGKKIRVTVDVIE